MSKDEMQEQVVDKKKNRIVLFAGILGVLLLVVLGVVITPHIISANKDRKVNEQLEEAQHFLDDLDYEQAIVAYEAVIEIDPMSVDAYLGLADAYVAMGDYDNAIRVLEEGYAATQSEEIKRELDTLKISLDEQSETNLSSQEEDEPLNEIPEDAYFFQNQITEEGVIVQAENLFVSTNNATNEIVITIEGLSLQDDYVTNRATTRKDAQEYNWGVTIYSQDKEYKVATTSWAYDPGREGLSSISGMQSSVWVLTERHTFENVASAEVRYTENSITWTFDSSMVDYLDFSTVNKYVVNIYEIDKENENREYYLEDNQLIQ